MTLFENDYDELVRDLLAAPVIHRGEWQSMTTSGSPIHATHELTFVTTRTPVNLTQQEWDAEVKPDQPWAEEHFQERVSGIPHNPAPSHVRWPYGYTDRHQTHGDKFDHTYPERFWPRWESTEEGGPYNQDWAERQGIRFRYGDLQDVVDLMAKRPLTRQAFLPVWFPEDTGATAGQRVPCTIGYHFLITDGKLDCAYYMRSCDIIRHYRNDVYMAGRLMQWVCEQINQRWREWGSDPVMSVQPGMLNMHISSLHLFTGDRHKVQQKVRRG